MEEEEKRNGRGNTSPTSVKPAGEPETKNTEVSEETSSPDTSSHLQNLRVVQIVCLFMILLKKIQKIKEHIKE